MPIYDFKCENGHVKERLVSLMTRDDPASCGVCGSALTRIMHVPHALPDGVYSYMPNVGDPVAFEKRIEAQRSGQRVIDRSV